MCGFVRHHTLTTFQLPPKANAAYSPPRRPHGDQVWRPDYRMQKHCALL
jgi:hypothetical protein